MQNRQNANGVNRPHGQNVKTTRAVDGSVTQTDPQLGSGEEREVTAPLRASPRVSVGLGRPPARVRGLLLWALAPHSSRDAA